MPRYAAIDIGSNSVRLLVAEASMDARQRQPSLGTIHQDRNVTRLGAGVFQTGRLDEQAIALVCATLERMAEAYKRLDVVGVRAVATAAVRDASNQQEFIERASAAAGTPVEIISGQEEARLIHLGVQARWPHPQGRILTIDVGGGSCELIVAERGQLVTALSKPLGAVRLTEVFLKNDPPSDAELHRLSQSIDERLTGAAARLGGGFQRIIATSGTAAAIVCAVNRVPRARREEADRLRATTVQVRRFFKEVRARSLAERKQVSGIGPRRAEIIVAGAAVFLRLLEMFHHPSMYYLAAGVRDGIIADLLSRGVGRELTHLNADQRRAVEEMARRYGVNLRHARKVASMALALFESLRPVHRLPPANGRLLEAAAYLHDAGHFISDTGHHKHSAYIVANSDMPGFTDEERLVVAMLCRYHRKAMPAPRHSNYQDLGAELRKQLLQLIPIMRLADALDRGHEQRVDGVDCQMRNGGLVLRLDSDQDVDLEQWAADRAGDAFRSVYQMPLAVTRAKGGE
ncbi:MAG: Ppx/GppA family phosphatase [Acidobacteria bacterium]|nr:Ppx/GppA family phosphatase [Acidobacteriota bacterium]